MLRTLVMLVIVLSATILVACRATPESSTPQPVPPTAATPFSKQEYIDLSDLSSWQSSVPVEIGDRVKVSIDVSQPGDKWARCAKPTVEDAYGNVLAVLSPNIDEPGRRNVGASYRYAFYAPEVGQYRVVLDNLECNVRETKVEVTVTWIVYKR